MKINLKKRSSKILKGVAILFLLFMFANVAVSTVQAQETQKDYKLLWSYEIGNIVEDVSVSSDGSYIVAGSRDQKVYFLNRNGELLWSYETGGPVYDVAVSSDCSYIAAGSQDNKAYFFNRNGELLWSYETGGPVYDVAVSSDGSYIATGSRDNTLYFFNCNGELLWSYKTDQCVKYVSISYDGTYIAAGSWYNEWVYFFNRNGELLWSYKTCSSWSGSALRNCGDSISYEGSYIAVVGDVDMLYLFNRNGELLWSYETDGDVMDGSVSSDGSYIAVGSWQNENVYLFNRNGELLWSYEADDPVTRISISSDGSYIAAGSWAGKVYFFTTLERFANVVIEEAKMAVESERAKGFNIAEAENLLSQAEQAFNKGDYDKAKELAEQAMDVDGDGVPNEEDFAPSIKNNYIYAGGVVLTAAFTGAGFVFSRNRKKRKEYRARVSEYRAKIEQWKREGYDVSELEEMLR